MYRRNLDLKELLKRANFFLFGPRSTGKSYLIKNLFPQALVVSDEIQKLPKLLDEVHRLIEKKNIRYLLTGSSVRKLKRAGANLLGGRAREAQLFPLTFNEITDFNLNRYLNFGGIPRIYLSTEPEEDLLSYIRTYLAEEIKSEAAVRNYDRFVRFLETMALSNAKELNYQKLSQESGVPARTLEGYLEVLTDTLIAFQLHPYE